MGLHAPYSPLVFSVLLCWSCVVFQLDSLALSEGVPSESSACASAEHTVAAHMPTCPCLSAAMTTVLVFSGWTTMEYIRSLVTFAFALNVMPWNCAFNRRTSAGNVSFSA